MVISDKVNKSMDEQMRIEAEKRRREEERKRRQQEESRRQQEDRKRRSVEKRERENMFPKEANDGIMETNKPKIPSIDDINDGIKMQKKLLVDAHDQEWRSVMSGDDVAIKVSRRNREMAEQKVKDEKIRLTEAYSLGPNGFWAQQSKSYGAKKPMIEDLTTGQMARNTGQNKELPQPSEGYNKGMNHAYQNVGDGIQLEQQRKEQAEAAHAYAKGTGGVSNYNKGMQHAYGNVGGGIQLEQQRKQQAKIAANKGMNHAYQNIGDGIQLEQQRKQQARIAANKGMNHAYGNIGDGIKAEQERKQQAGIAANKGMNHAYGNIGDGLKAEQERKIAGYNKGRLNAYGNWSSEVGESGSIPNGTTRSDGVNLPQVSSNDDEPTFASRPDDYAAHNIPKDISRPDDYAVYDIPKGYGTHPDDYAGHKLSPSKVASEVVKPANSGERPDDYAGMGYSKPDIEAVEVKPVWDGENGAEAGVAELFTITDMLEDSDVKDIVTSMIGLAMNEDSIFSDTSSSSELVFIPDEEAADEFYQKYVDDPEALAALNNHMQGVEMILLSPAVAPIPGIGVILTASSLAEEGVSIADSISNSTYLTDKLNEGSYYVKYNTSSTFNGMGSTTSNYTVLCEVDEKGNMVEPPHLYAYVNSSTTIPTISPNGGLPYTNYDNDYYEYGK